MAYTNNLLFNNVFLKTLSPGAEELAAARHLVHNSARDWYPQADFSTPAGLVKTWLQPLLNQQSLDLVPVDGVDSVWAFVAPWAREKHLALCFIAPYKADLGGMDAEGRVSKGQHWMIRAVNTALDTPGIRWVVLTNGIQWRLLDSQALRRYEAFLEVDLVRLLEGEEDDLAAYLFYRLFRLEGSFDQAEETGHNQLDVFVQESNDATSATEAYLKTTVSDNLNTQGGGDGIMAHLCMGLVRAVDPKMEKSFNDDERGAIYRDATYLLYRLMFILYAEARSLLPMDREAYRAISLERLINEAADLRLHPHLLAKPSTSLWDQLTTLFSAIEFSDEYLGIPAYNGGLFSSEDKPYISKYKVQNTFIAEALYELAYLSEPGSETPERIDYRDLSVRHLGSLYEGMIEYQLYIAEERLLARRDKEGRVKYLPAEGQEIKANDEVIEAGKVYFAQSPHERKATGTHYTAEDLVERLVRQTVLRLLNERWEAFSQQMEKWQAEIEQASDQERNRLQRRLDAQLEDFVRQQVLTLRACDPAMGSGHFLVHIAHQVTNFILWVLTRTPWENKSVNLAPDFWRRQVVENCLYGVDINQMAVELAKLSLWLATMQIGSPLSFLDHHLKWGNSLLGASLDEILDALAHSDLTKSTHKSRVAEEKGQYGFTTLPQAVQTIHNANDWLEKITAQIVTRAEDIKTQEYDYEEAQRLLSPYKKIGDLLVACKMGLKAGENEIALIAKAIEVGTLSQLSPEYQKMLEKAGTVLLDQHTVHWELEFSSVFGTLESGAFDIVIGNPPFLGGLKISSELGSEFLKYLKLSFIPNSGTADLCSYFFRLGFELNKINGYLGMVSTNTIAQGDTRQTGLAVILQKGGNITFGERFMKWGGDASVEVNLVVIKRGSLPNGQYATLDGNPVPIISSMLDDLPEIEPSILFQNKKKAFIGEYIRGIGFVVDNKQGAELIKSNSKNKDCLRPFLNGRDINESPNYTSDRMVICFEDWPIEKASMYPELLSIAEELVKPERMKLPPNTSDYRKIRDRWWQFARFGLEMRRATNNLERVLIRSAVSELHVLAFLPRGQVFSHALVIFAFDDYFHFTLLQSNIHEVWLRRQASSLGTSTRYTPTDCFQTFPFPQSSLASEVTQAEQAGKEFYEHRQQIMGSRQLGLAKMYNLSDDPACQDADILEMRRLQATMDAAVLACYGWQDINLRHDFYPNNRKKIRFTPSPEAQRELFTRLIALNQEIAAQEAAKGLVAESATDEEDAEAE